MWLTYIIGAVIAFICTFVLYMKGFYSDTCEKPKYLTLKGLILTLISSSLSWFLVVGYLFLAIIYAIEEIPWDAKLIKLRKDGSY